jgi:hypothetical protein
MNGEQSIKVYVFDMFE